VGARLIVPALAVCVATLVTPARGEDFVRGTANAARSAALRLDLAHASPAADSALAAPLARLMLESHAVDGVHWRTLGRMQHTLFVPARPTPRTSASADLDTVMSYVSQVLVPQYDARFGEAATDSQFAPFDSLVKHRHLVALGRNERALQKYERKYGPGSARLNLLEVAINHFLQAGSWFGPGAEGPGPFELIAGYSTSYAAAADERATAVSVLEAGLRCYFFADGWGEERGWTGYFRPRFASVGVAVAGARDGPFRFPGGAGRARVGPFVSWGGIKLAYVGGREQRFMVSRQLHLVPNLF
jgi:hypothetical protein